MVKDCLALARTRHHLPDDALTYRESEGQPRFWADFSNWNFNPNFPASAFTFYPPPGTRPLPFAADLIRQSAAKAPAEGEAR